MRKFKFIMFLMFASIMSIALFTSCKDAHEHSFVEGKCECGEVDPNYVPPHVHSYQQTVTNPTCTEKGYTTYTCSCGDTYKADEVEALCHTYNSVVTDPTCTEAGYTTYTCECGDTYKADEVPARHTYTSVVTDPTCTEVGYTTYTCSCGDTYKADEVEVVPHVDKNLDITCDYEGCTKRILPAADSQISLFTARHMIIISLSSSYYMEGVVTEVKDAMNGGFIITDEAGDSIYVRLPKDADGNSYSKWTNGKVVLGDTIRLYGKPSNNTDTSTNKTYPAKVEGAILTVVKHEHVFSEATCDKAATCACLATSTPALGHADENADNYCDRCQWNLKIQITDIAISTDGTTGGVVDENKTHWTWGNEDFGVVIAKGTSTYTLYTTSKAYMQLKKLNTLTVSSKNGMTIHSITISATNATQLNNLKSAIGTAYTYTENTDDLSVTINWDSAEDFVLVNNGTNTVYINNVKIAYEKN